MSDTSIKLIVGLGNPGAKYTKTRHNAGFWLVEALANHCQQTFRMETKFSGEVCKVNIAGNAVWLLKPMTFMNKSGLSVKQVASFYKIPVQSILVAHDELDLPAGIARLKQAGGHGGHNGLRDIHAHLTNDYLRLRLGIGHPGDRSKVVDYVLSNIGRDDEISLTNGINRVLLEIDNIVNGELQKAMNSLHSE